MNNSPEQTKVDFDKYADEYEGLLQDQLNFFSADRSYFSRYKAEILKLRAPVGHGQILDFGSGIGLMIPSLQEAFPFAKIHASDISEASLRHLAQRFPQAIVLSDSDLPNHQFDLILIATVLHHIEPPLRKTVMQRLGTLVKPGGRICIFEHNPLNPITRKMVSTCPFDEDAVLLGIQESSGLIEVAGLDVEKRGYTLFVPPSMSAIRPIEKFLEWLPLGGQYYVIGQKPSL